MQTRSGVALFLSLFIHFLLFMLIFLHFDSENLYKPPRMGSENGERVSLKHFRFQQGTQGIQSAPNLQENRQQTQESKQLQKQEPREERQARPKDSPQTKAIAKKQKEEAKQPIATKKPSKPAQQPSKQSPPIPQRQASKQQEPSLASSLRQSRPSSPSIYDYGEIPSQEIRELYGEEFGALNPNQQRFLKSNLDSIGRITQSYLRYPRIAGKVGQEGDNIVEFYLHPNGDISNLRLLTSSGYTLLDDNSLHTIRIAYKDYPYPSEKTKIRIRVMYRIY